MSKKHKTRTWQNRLTAIFIFSAIASLIVGFYYIFTPSDPPLVTSINPQLSLPVSVAQSSQTCSNLPNLPTDNPITTQYGKNAYAWTNNLKWNCVYPITAFSGTTLDNKLKQAIETVAKNGGGVIYFPAGVYEFQESIYLKNKVILRGETPSHPNAKSVSYNPPAKFIFPEYKPRLSGNGTPNETAFKEILTTSPDTDSNLGIVNLDINRAGIEIKGNQNSSQNRNIVIYGINSNNVAQPDAKIPNREFQPGWVRYCDRFSANIRVTALENVLIANNRVNDNITDSYNQPGYVIKSLDGKRLITYSEGEKVPFDYGNHYGIVVNRSGQFGWSETPQTQPGLFRKGIVIRDNWVYHTMRVAIHASGQGLLIKNNEIHDNQNKQWWTDPTGIKEPRGAVTYENRAIDWSGWDVHVEENQYEVYRHRVMATQYYSVDGEGILIQECCGGTQVNGAIVRRNKGNTYIGFYKVPDIKNVTIAENELFSNSPENVIIYVNADTNNRKATMNQVKIENNLLDGSISAKASQGGTGNIILNNRSVENSFIDASCHVTVEANLGLTVKPCQ